MIKLMKEIETFEELEDICWSGATRQLEQVEKKGLEQELICLLEDISYVEPFKDETELNDFIWFGLKTYEPFDKLWEEDSEEE